jgi:hypothetical protein
MAGPDHSQPQHDLLAVLFGANRRRRLHLFILIAVTFLFLLFAKVFLPLPGNVHPQPSIATKNETLTPYHPLKSETEPVVFSLIMWSEDAAAEGALLLKVDLPLIPRISSPDSELPRPS